MGEWRNMWVNLKIGPSEKDTYIRELLRHNDALKTELADIKRGDWVARVFDAEAKRDNWRDVATRLATLNDVCWHCGVPRQDNCYVLDAVEAYRNLVDEEIIIRENTQAADRD